MIVTLTPNPSLDRTVEIERLERGRVHRAVSVRVDPGGKGINVATALVLNGHRVRAVLPVGGREGQQLRDALDQRGIPVAAVQISEPVRTNLSLTEPDGTVTKINAPGPRLTDAEHTALTDAVAQALHRASWIAGCGSLPPGISEELYAELVDTARDAGVRVAVDSSGPALAAAVAAGPDLIKPNVDELAEITDRAIHTIGDVIDAANLLRGKGVGTVVVSLGPDGAVLVDDDGAWHGTTPPIVVRSAVGAGDALLAGLLAADGAGREALRLGVAYGTAAARLPGTTLPGPDDLDLDAVQVRAADPRHPLTEPGGTT